MWASTGGADDLAALLAGCPGIRWVQLPWAGIEPFVAVLDDTTVDVRQGGVRRAGRRAGADPGAGRPAGLDAYARAGRWTRAAGPEPVRGGVTILGGGGITEELLALLAPFGCRVTVVRRHPAPMAGAVEVVGPDGLRRRAPGAPPGGAGPRPDAGDRWGPSAPGELAAMDDDAWLVNVARGGHIVTDDLVAALRDGASGAPGST